MKHQVNKEQQTETEYTEWFTYTVTVLITKIIADLTTRFAQLSCPSVVSNDDDSKTVGF